jgi:hypothetical protein
MISGLIVWLGALYSALDLNIQRVLAEEFRLYLPSYLILNYLYHLQFSKIKIIQQKNIDG